MRLYLIVAILFIFKIPTTAQEYVFDIGADAKCKDLFIVQHKNLVQAAVLGDRYKLNFWGITKGKAEKLATTKRYLNTEFLGGAQSEKGYSFFFIEQVNFKKMPVGYFISTENPEQALQRMEATPDNDQNLLKVTEFFADNSLYTILHKKSTDELIIRQWTLPVNHQEWAISLKEYNIPEETFSNAGYFPQQVQKGTKEVAKHEHIIKEGHKIYLTFLEEPGTAKDGTEIYSFNYKVLSIDLNEKLAEIKPLALKTSSKINSAYYKGFFYTLSVNERLVNIQKISTKSWEVEPALTFNPYDTSIDPSSEKLSENRWKIHSDNLLTDNQTLSSEKALKKLAGSARQPYIVVEAGFAEEDFSTYYTNFQIGTFTDVAVTTASMGNTPGIMNTTSSPPINWYTVLKQDELTQAFSTSNISDISPATYVWKNLVLPKIELKEGKIKAHDIFFAPTEQKGLFAYISKIALL